MPDLLKLYLRQCLIGFGIAAVFVALLLGISSCPATLLRA